MAADAPQEKNRQVRVAVIQAQPAAFQREAGCERACQLLAEAAANGAQLTLFPEAYIPAYPRGLTFGTAVGSRSRAGRELWRLYWEQAVEGARPAHRTVGRSGARP